MLLLIIFINAISYLALLYQYQNNLISIQNNDIKMKNNTLNDLHVGNNNNTHYRFLMQPRIYNI
jgi:hypothetical protein